jgi:putative cardiolipin synthase
VFYGCSAALVDVPRPLTRAIEHPEQTHLGRTLSAPPGKSGFHLVASGDEAFLARAALADVAEQSLDLQYYIIAEDATATLLLYRALQAANRGVRVRLLIDDMYALGRDFDLATLAVHPNVQVRVFNPFLRRGPLGISQLLDLIGDGARLNRRMHNKLWIADNAAALVGGRNLGDAYFQTDPQSSFADLDVLAAGAVVRDISLSFDEYWNSEWSVPIAAFPGERPKTEDLNRVLTDMAARAGRFRDTDYARNLRNSSLARDLHAGNLPLIVADAKAIYDAPAKLDAATAPAPISPLFRNMIEGAQHEVILISPYLIPSARGMEVLTGLAGRGVRVRVLTNSLASTDVAVVHAGYARHRPKLLAGGVEVHERRPTATESATARRGLSSGASLHAKAIVVDRKWVLIGSMNLDPRSRESNTEIGVLVESEALGKQLGELFDDSVSAERAYRVSLAVAGDVASPLAWTIREGQADVVYDSEPLASWWRRILASLFGALAPEALL